MLLAENYRKWFLPSLVKVPVWREYIDALLDEICTLQMYNMGSYNAWGFNGVEEDISLVNKDQWVLGVSYNSGIGEIAEGGEFALASSLLSFTGSGTKDSVCVAQYPFVLDRGYRIQCIIYDIMATGSLQLSIGIGSNSQTYDLTGESGKTISVDVTLTCEDYYLLFQVLEDNSHGNFKIKDLEAVGILNSIDEKERILVLKRIVDVNSASTDILEYMRDSISFPSIANMPAILLRQIIIDHNLFVGYAGSEIAAFMFFYFLGYSVSFDYLYAEKTDYNSEIYSYIAQKKEDTLVSVPGGTVYGQVNKSANASYVIELKSGHQVIVGDYIINQTTPFNGSMVEVLSVEDNTVSLVEAVTVVLDDYIDIYRKYPYAVNPDPDNYMKTSHIDVFFKQKYVEGVEVNFAKLEEYFLKYIPVNVVIRFFGYKTDIDEESFSLRETLFKVASTDELSIQLAETHTYPIDTVAYAVQNPTPVTGVDIFGTDVDKYSYLISHYDPVSGEPVYLVIPYPLT